MTKKNLKKDITNIQDKRHEGIRKDITAGKEELKKKVMTKATQSKSGETVMNMLDRYLKGVVAVVQQQA
jgi:hypothetical protein